jgi:hypothetical protein
VVDAGGERELVVLSDQVGDESLNDVAIRN